MLSSSFPKARNFYSNAAAHNFKWAAQQSNTRNARCLSAVYAVRRPRETLRHNCCFQSQFATARKLVSNAAAPVNPLQAELTCQQGFCNSRQTDGSIYDYPTRLRSLLRSVQGRIASYTLNVNHCVHHSCTDSRWAVLKNTVSRSSRLV